MKSGRTVEIGMAVYVVIGVAAMHLTLRDLILSGVCGLLSFAVLVGQKRNLERFGEYDCWGWSRAATQGSLVGGVIILVGGTPLLEKVGQLSTLESAGLFLFYWEIVEYGFFAIMMGVAVYFRGYLVPLQDKRMDPRSLELEHREWLNILQLTGILAGIGFIATGFSYLTGLMKETPIAFRGDEAVVFSLVRFAYLVVGYLGWIIRPIYGRGKEIRDHLNKLKQQGKLS